MVDSSGDRYRLRLDPNLVPGRFRPRSALHPVHPLNNPLSFALRWNLPLHEWFERARRYTLMGDPPADDWVALYPRLGFEQATRMLDTALDNGIAAVPDAPTELKMLFAQLDHPPAWVDWQRIERGAAVMRRYAPLSWLFMRLAFAMTYVNANAGLPLYLSGSLGPKTVTKRLLETSRWRLELHMPGGLRRFGCAFKTTVRVRVLHAMVRLHLIRHPEWNIERLGMPIPQIDMAGANIGMFFTHSLLLRTLGVRMSGREYRDVLHLWRYQGWVVGLVDDLNPGSPARVNALWRLLSLTLRNRFDPRARELTQSTLRASASGRRTGGSDAR